MAGKNPSSPGTVVTHFVSNVDVVVVTNVDVVVVIVEGIFLDNDIVECAVVNE